MSLSKEFILSLSKDPALAKRDFTFQFQKFMSSTGVPKNMIKEMNNCHSSPFSISDER